MAQFKQWFEQDFMRPIKVQHCESVMFTGDDKGALVGVRLFDNGVAYSGGGTVTGAVKRSDSGLVALTGAISGNAASVVIPAAALAYPGPIGVHIILNQGGSVTTVLKAVYSVDDNNGVPVDPGTIIPSINDLITAIDTAVASIPSDYSDLLAEVEELQELDGKMLSSENFSYTGVEKSHSSISNTGLWTYNSTQESYTFEIGSDVKTITVTGGANGSIVAFLNSYSPTTGNSVDFATGFTERITLAANETKSFVVSGGMHYFFALLKDSSANDKTPAVVFGYMKTDATLTQRHVPADGKAAGDAVNKLYINITHDSALDTESQWVITSQNVWAKISDNPSRSKTFRIPKNAVRIAITAGAYNAVVTCLRTVAPVASTTPDYSTGWGRTTITAGNSITFDVGPDCNYLYCTATSTAGNDITPTVVIAAVRSEDNMLYPIDAETESESGKHDRADEIMSMLNTFGVCTLAPGVYYTGKNIVMPAGTMIQGSGANTVIRPLASVATISTIKMGPRCTVKDLMLKGSDSGQKTIDPGNRYGIEWTSSEQIHGAVENCKVVNFSGAGIYLHDTTANTQRNLAISDCYIAGNSVGIDIYQNSEFNRIVNCTLYSNGIGYRNRGGNNNMSNCGIDSNIQGIEIDNDDNASNTGHGTITGCSINHSDNRQLANGQRVTYGYGLIIRGSGRMVVANCNFYYSKLKLQDTNGNVFTGCGFGSQTTWEISGTSLDNSGGCSIFNGCMVKQWIYGDDGVLDGGGIIDSATRVIITNNTATKVASCFDRAGNAYTPPA